MATSEELEIARRLFTEGWGGDHPDSPLQFMTEDIIMRDVQGHPEAMHGYQAVRDFWGDFAGRLRVPVEDLYSSDRGVVVLWMAYGRIPDDASQNAGKWSCGEGMSRLEFREGKVCIEVDYWHGAQGVCDDWQEHFARRQAMPRRQRGAITGA